jgi:hypothetical protein
MIVQGVGGASGWAPSVDLAAAGARTAPIGGLEDAAVADRALELILAGETQVANGELRGSIAAIRSGSALRVDGRATIRALAARIHEANEHKTAWQKFVEAFSWIGKIVGAVAAVVASVASFGAAVPGAVVLGLSLAAGGAGMTAALGKLGVGAHQSEALKLQADQQQEKGEVQQVQEQMSREEAAAQVVLAAEGAMRERAMVWIGIENEGRRTAAALGAAR